MKTSQLDFFPVSDPDPVPAASAVDAVDAFLGRLEPWYPDVVASMRALTAASDARQRLIAMVAREAPTASHPLILAALRDRGCVA